MKILITGASGLLGRAIYRKFKQNPDWVVLGTAHTRMSEGLTKLDLLSKGASQSLVAEFKPDIIIHSAAERRPDVVEKDPGRAEKLNVETVGIMAQAAERRGIPIIYISTNYVFDGTTPPYTPSDKPNPLNEYGRMKLAGEEMALQNCSKAIVLRVPVLYGGEITLSESSVLSIATKISNIKATFHDNEATRYPTHCADVASVICGLSTLIKEGKSTQGVYHWSSESPFTKFEIAKMMAEIMGIDEMLIKEAKADPNAAPRPLNAHLNTEAIRALGLASEHPIKDALKESLSKYQQSPR